jgi:hypothetical protein
MSMHIVTLPHAPSSLEYRALDDDAELALQTLSEQVAIVARDASFRARILGRAVRSSYADALGGSTNAMWRRFVSTLSDFAFELDRCPPQRTLASIVARRALDGIVVENIDLLA